MRALSVAAASLLLFSLLGCEKARDARSTEDELEELVIKFYTAATFDDWSACLDEESAKMFSRDAWEKRPGPILKKEDFKITKVQVSNSSGVVYCEHTKARKPFHLWAVRKKGQERPVAART